MDAPTSVMIPVGDIKQDFLPGGAYNPKDPTHAQLVIEKFQRDGGAAGLFNDVYFDGLIVQISHNSDAEQELTDCIELLELGGFGPAIPRLEALLEKYPYHATLLYNTGMAYREVGKLERSIVLLDRLTAVAPEHLHGWVALSVSFFSIRQSKAALGAIERAYALDADDPFVLRTLGTLHAAMGSEEKAVPFLEQALAKMPSDAQSHITLAKIKLPTAPSDAKAHLQAAIKAAPGSSIAEMAAKMLDEM